ncbi:MAG: ATP-binding protein, partial [Spirulina sp. SIO3F2]|nr:ATP-binding protein [Spirulina sp. SIO3F2]
HTSSGSPRYWSSDLGSFPDLAAPLVPWLTPLPRPSDTLPLSPTYQALSQQIVTLWSGAAGAWPLIALHGLDPRTHQHMAAAACDCLGVKILALPATALPAQPQELTLLQHDWEREAILRDAVLFLAIDRLAPNEPSHDSTIRLFLNRLTTPAIISSHDRLSLLDRAVITLDVPPLPHTEQVALWAQHLGETATALKQNAFNRHLDRLISQFQLTPTTIQIVAQQWQQQATINVEAEAIAAQLWTFCRQQARPNLDDLAQRIPACATWEDLVLPDRPRQQLEDIATHLNHRAGVYQDWGFAAKSDRGLGISALFWGESGTGKTMAAEVIADACQLDLYRIDLSTVVSKYIGETEKNLRRIFDAAEAGGVILLFDEADALFGKRSEVKDSRDRHANIEVSYLLQRMEAYQGLAILTSNLKHNLDQAFLRRLRFIVAFPFPDAESRAAIWQRIFPPQTPTQALDFAKLGQLKVAGGNIRNIALNAAFLAAKDQHPVTMAHIRQAAQRDYLKLEKLLTREETAGWEED